MFYCFLKGSGVMYRKNFITLLYIYFSILLFVLLQFGSFASTSTHPKVFVNSKLLVSDPQPIIVNGRIMIPLRALLNSLGVSDNFINWNQHSKEASFIHNDISIKLVVDNLNVTVSDKKTLIDVPPIIYKDRVLIPARFVSETLGYIVEWEDTTKTAYISSSVVKNMNSEALLKDSSTELLKTLKSNKMNVEYEIRHQWLNEDYVLNKVVDRWKNESVEKTIPINTSIKGTLFEDSNDKISTADQQFEYTTINITNSSLGSITKTSNTIKSVTLNNILYLNEANSNGIYEGWILGTNDKYKLLSPSSISYQHKLTLYNIGMTILKDENISKKMIISEDTGSEIKYKGKYLKGLEAFINPFLIEDASSGIFDSLGKQAKDYSLERLINNCESTLTIDKNSLTIKNISFKVQTEIDNTIRTTYLNFSYSFNDNIIVDIPSELKHNISTT